MSESRVIQEIAQKEIDQEDIADEVIKQPELLSDVMTGLGSHSANIKFGCAKVLRLISEKEPALLYPEMDFFIGHLDNENNIFKWTAICILANLSAVDSQNRIEEIFDKYFMPITGPVLITASNIIAGAAKIAEDKGPVLELVQRQLTNARDGTRKKAAKFLEKYSPQMS